MRGFTGLQGPIGLVKTVNVNDPDITLVPFIPIGATIYPTAIYLNAPSSYYTIDISRGILGPAYQPKPFGPGEWLINSIFVGPPPTSGIVPKFYYDMSQQPVTFFFQNVGNVPIKMIFGSNDSDTSIIYLSFGTSPNQTPSSYVLQPLSTLIIQAIFTSNNAIRFYNSFLDALNYNHLYRILDRAVKSNYLVAPSAPPSHVTINQLYVDTTFKLADLDLAQNEYTIERPITITLDGEGIPVGSINLFVFAVRQTSTLILKDLVGIANFKGVGVPQLMNAGSSWLIVIDYHRVTAYDPSSVHLHKLTYTNVKSTNKDYQAENESIGIKVINSISSSESS